MVNFLYQRFIIFTDYKEDIYKLLKNINYTNYKIVFFCNELTDKMQSDAFVDFVSINTNNKNNIIFDYSTHLLPNDIFLFTDIITETMLITLNNRYLNDKPRIITNSKWFGKSFKSPEYWCCKNYIIQELNKQVYKKDIEKLELVQACGDIASNSNIVIEELFPIKNNILTIDSSNRNKYKYVPDTIHVIMATYERNENLEIIFNSLCEQSEKKFHFHLLDNNIDKEKQKEIDIIIERFSEKLHISLHRYNYNYHCIARLYIIQNLIKLGFVEYVIVFDDDQLHHSNWIENILSNKKSLSTLSWYGKIFDNNNYWFEGSDLKKILTYNAIEEKRREDVKRFKYFGPGGCIFDINLFLFNELYHYQKYSNYIFKFDDIWLSFALDKYMNIPFHRMMYHPKECIDRNNLQNMTWAKCKLEKPLLFNYLSQKYDWNVLDVQEPFITVNTFFSKIYVLYENNHQLLKMKQILLEMNIAANFVFNENRTVTVRNIFEEAVQENLQSVLLFNSTIIFHKFFHHLFHKYIKYLPENWNILYLGQDTCKIDNSNGIFPLTQDVTGLHGVAYNIDAIEMLLAYDLHKTTDVLHDNKIIEKTIVKNNYFIHPGLVVNDIIEKDKINNYNLLEIIDIPVTIYLFDIDNIPTIHYSHCIFKDVQEISNCETDYFVVINNKNNCYYDINIIQTGLYYLIISDSNTYCPRQCCIETVDNINYHLWCNYIKYTNKEHQENKSMFFCKKGEKIDIVNLEVHFDKQVFIF